MELNKASVSGASRTAGSVPCYIPLLSHRVALWLWRAVRVGKGVAQTATGDVSLSSLQWSSLPATTHTRLLTYKLWRMQSSLKPAEFC